MNLLIVRNNSNTQAIDASLLLATYLQTQGIDCALFDSSDLSALKPDGRIAEVLAAGVDMAVALGGDGTILRTARAIGTSGVPILGINFGHLGFLANSSDDGVVAIVAAALAGEVAEERRANLHIEVVCEGERDPWADDGDGAWAQAADVQDEGRAGELCAPHSFFALNEAAVTRGALGRIVDFELSVSGARIANMRGDGLVVASATGSTAYALSAGGPLVAPSFGGLVAVPLAPHTLHARPIVTAENDVVEMDLSDNAATREATLFIDGDIASFETPIQRLYFRRGGTPTVLLRYSGKNFYEYASKVFF